ncbi:PREDICTED: uncharacterized protein LOC104720880 [Camelina sativa]|uniref:Uncharacterized protein LOC104720880 n=1 Tax=Camelina sativa TaxID=90675 RepID=A0ABM0U7E1_CAMSA|nr:PREDICTED: uncharacterized protein LOC104720880 [Camelina sativa]
MPKRKAKECVKLTEEDKNDDNKRIRREDLVDEEVERQIAAIRAIRDVEIEQTLTALRLLRSYFTEEQLDTPVLDFFKENLPDLTISRNEESGEIELKWKDENGDPSDGVGMNYSTLKRLSMGFPDLYNSSRPSLGGYDLPDNVKASLLGTDNPQLENLVFQRTSDNHMLASHAAFQTPGVNGQRLSFGMTPKTRRLPKPGEMMLSVHGSPLGVYKEDHNIGAINEENS